MIFNSTGQIVEGFYMLGHPAAPVYLLDNGVRPAIFDSGFSFMGNRYIEDIRAILGHRDPSYLFLTHSHFDHCGAAGMLKNAFPNMSILASPLARTVLNKTTALKMIKDLNREATALAGGLGINSNRHPEFRPFTIDNILSGDDIVPLGNGETLRVIETPGHSRDSLSFYIPEKGILLTGEAFGIPDASGYIISECLSNYHQYAESIHKLMSLQPDILCLGHYKVFTGTDVSTYMAESRTYCINFKTVVNDFLAREKGDLGRVMARFKKLEYDGKREDAHPEAAYRINLKARIKAVLACDS